MMLVLLFYQVSELESLALDFGLRADFIGPGIAEFVSQKYLSTPKIYMSSLVTPCTF